MYTASSNDRRVGRKFGSIFNITERNEESEITGGTCSILSNLLRADNEEALKNRLTRLSLLSNNLNANTDLLLTANNDEDEFNCFQYNHKIFQTVQGSQ